MKKKTKEQMTRPVTPVTEAEFRELLGNKLIRPASLEDVHGTHHRRALYRHPNTQQYYVAVRQ